MNDLLDTNACIEFLNGTSPSLIDAMHAHSPSELALCSVVKAELLFGARNSQRVEENLSTLEEFFRPFESLPFDDRSAEIYGRTQAELPSSRATNSYFTISVLGGVVIPDEKRYQGTHEVYEEPNCPLAGCMEAWKIGVAALHGSG